MSSTIHVKQILCILQGIFLLFLVTSCSQENSQEKVLTIGTGSTAGNYDKTGLAIVRIVNKGQQGHGIRLEVKGSAGSVANIDAIMQGDAEFGFAQADRQYQAVNGLAEWKEKGPQKDLRAICSLYTEAVTLVADRDAGVNTVHDLRDKRVDIGPPGSGIRQNAIDVLDNAGINWDRDIKTYEENSDDRLRMLMHGQLDALFHTVGHPSTDIKFLTLSMRGVRFIPLDNIETLLAKYPYYSRSVIPVRELYPHATNSMDVETIGVKATLLTSAKVPDDVVYAVTKAVFNGIADLGEHVPVLRTLRKEEMLEGLTAPIHPGALKYYREIGLVGMQARAETKCSKAACLSWEAPSKYEDGAELPESSLAGFKIYVCAGKVKPDCETMRTKPKLVIRANPTERAHTVNLSDGTYFCAVTTLVNNTPESTCSNIEGKTI
jgi:TRAP transporter TAXI family solute receptor